MFSSTLLCLTVDNVQKVAAQSAAPFNPNVKIFPIHANIKEPQYDVDWFKQFDIVLNALDNLGTPLSLSLFPYRHSIQHTDARRHVNKMCMAGDIPLVESGTAGYLGQVQPLLKVTFQKKPSHTQQINHLP